MKLFKIKDNSVVLKADFYDIQNLMEKIADKTLGRLEREGIFVFPQSVKAANDITEEQFIIRSVNENYRTGNVMGILGYEDERLIIKSRFDKNEKDYFFQYLLEKVLDLPNIVDLKSDVGYSNRLFNFLLFLFPIYLKTAMRKGLFKTYIKRDYNDENIKGNIDIARHIGENTPFIGRVAYNRREFSYDNDLTELIRHTVEFIKGKSYGNRVLSKLTDEIKLAVVATPNYKACDRERIIEKNLKNPVRHAYFSEYLALQRLCLLILRYQKRDIGAGIKRIYGIIFDGAWLWEEYINLLVGNIFHHPMNRNGAGAQRLFDKNRGLIYPDFIRKNSDSRIIADAKYKPIDNIGNRDYLQVLAYIFRFDAKTGYYFYPESGERDDARLLMNRGSSYEGDVKPRDDIRVTKRGLKIPIEAKSYDEFATKMKICEGEFLNLLETEM